MSERATCWSVTINNPTASDEDAIAHAKQRSGWKVEGQLEAGEEGTQHYQLMVKTPQVRFSALKSAFPRAHIEVARNVKALSAYVHKDDTKIGELPVNDKFPTMDKFWLLFTTFVTDQEWLCRMESEEDRLQLLDEFCLNAINDGYHVESFGVNPQIRSAIKKYGFAIFHRSTKILRRQQTDRQTKLIPEDNNITNGTENEDAQSQTTQSTSSTSQSSSSSWSSIQTE